MRKSLLVAALCSAAAIAGSADAASYVYVGSWNVADGPLWSGAPGIGTQPPMSGVETAAYLFGGSAADYAISTVSTNVGDINFSAWVDGYGDTEFLKNPYGNPGTPVAQNFVGIFGSSYADGPGNYSAYVFDHACGAYYCDDGSGEISTNYAFRIGGVPEPVSWAMMVGGFGAIGAGLRRRRAQTTITFA